MGAHNYETTQEGERWRCVSMNCANEPLTNNERPGGDPSETRKKASVWKGKCYIDRRWKARKAECPCYKTTIKARLQFTATLMSLKLLKKKLKKITIIIVILEEQVASLQASGYHLVRARTTVPHKIDDIMMRNEARSQDDGQTVSSLGMHGVLQLDNKVKVWQSNYKSLPLIL